MTDEDRIAIEARLKEAEGIVAECREKLTEPEKPEFRHGAVCVVRLGGETRVAIEVGKALHGYHNEGYVPQSLSVHAHSVLWNIFDSLLPPDVEEFLLRASGDKGCIWSPSDIKALIKKYKVKPR